MAAPRAPAQASAAARNAQSPPARTTATKAPLVGAAAPRTAKGATRAKSTNAFAAKKIIPKRAAAAKAPARGVATFQKAKNAVH